MIKTTHFLLGMVLFCGIVCGRASETLPADVQRNIDALRLAASSNDWPSARKAYDRIDWRKVQHPAVVLKDISKELKGDNNAVALRKEVKTKYQLVRGGDDADLDDGVEATVIPFVQFVIKRFPPIGFGQLELVVVDLPSLQYTDQINPKQYSNAIVVLKTRDEKFLALMDLWETRYSRQIDYWDDKGNRIVPMGGSVLWLERKAVMDAAEKGGDYNKLWDVYNEHFQKAIGRRINLKRKR